MILQGFKRLLKQDYQQQYQDLVDKMSYIVNQMDSLFSAFSNNISLTDNIDCTVATVSVTVDSTGKPTTSASFQLNFTDSVLGCVVLQARNTGNTITYPTGAPFLTYTQTTNNGNNIITINNITGLAAGIPYSLTIVAFSGS